jgi:hypothetical protein
LPPTRPSRHGVEIEFRQKFVRPLLYEMWWTQYCKTVYLAAIDQLPKNEAGLDRFAYAYVVGDHQPDDG